MASFWISFFDSERPVGQKNTGVVIVEAQTEEAAIAGAQAAGLCPGGEPQTVEDITWRQPPVEWFNRILSPKEARDVTRLMCIASQDRLEDDEED
jgi:hypothetical protein